MPTIPIKNKLFSYTIKRKSIKSLNLHFKSPTSFYISCHKLTPNFIINNFISKNHDWIYKNSSKVITYPVIKNLKTLNILGQIYQVNFYPSTKNNLSINSTNKSINFYTTNLSQKNLKSLFEKKAKILAKGLIIDQIEQIPYPNKSSIKSISTRNQKSRFGSCSGHQRLSFNWQIIFFPKDKFRHIICHELVHLSIKNHQKNFYQALSNLDPNWKQNNTWLKTEAKKYFLIKP